MSPIHRRAVRRSICIAFGLTSLAIAGGAAAQPGYTDGITVYGHRGPYRVPDSVTELSRSVGYADLDLTTQAGRAELDWRIRDTAQDLCARLGEEDERGRNSSVLPTCQASARQGAYGQVRRAVEAQQYQAANSYWAAQTYPAAAPAYYSQPQYSSAPVYSNEPPYPAASQAWEPPPQYQPDPESYWSGHP